jgi:hypothetical protein
MDHSATNHFISLIQSQDSEICHYNECENIATEQIEVKAGDQLLTLLLCRIHVGDFENDKLIAEEENGA